MPWLYVAAHKEGSGGDTPIENFMPTVGTPSSGKPKSGSELLQKVMGMGAVVIPRSSGKGERTDGDKKHRP